MDAEDAELLLDVNILFLSLLKRRIAVRSKKKRRFWVWKVFRERERETYGAFHTFFNELRLFDRGYFCR